MAEGSTGEGLHGGSSGELTKFNLLMQAAGGGGKSPSIKTKKSKKTSLFKKSPSNDEFTRSSGRGKRKSGREKKLEHSREHLDDVQQAEVPSLPAAETSYQYDINTQEVEQKSTIDVKRMQKVNKEILRHNTQLAKLVDNLKKEKELLVSERVKLKSENKCLEKELKKSSTRDHRLTKKTSQPLFDDDVDDLKEKIQVLEDQLTERDRIASLLKQRLDTSQLEASEEPAEMEKSSNSIVLKNGSVLDSNAALEMLLEEHDTSLRMRRENEELKSRLTSMEAEAEGFKGQRDLVNASPKSARKRTSGFFKRGKKNNSSGMLKNEEAQQVRADLVRSQSPDVLVTSDSQLDVSISPLHMQKDSTTSLPNYNNGCSSPNLSPHTPTKSRAHAEIVTLQSCLRIAIEEKKTCNECIALLEKELDGTKSKIIELKDAISAAAKKADMESEKLKSNLEAAKLERDTFCGKLKIVQQEVDELVDKNEKMDIMYTASLGKKNKRIQELEQQVEALKKSKVASHNKPPAYAGVSAAPQKQASSARERVLSPPHQSKEISSGKTRSELPETSVAKSKQETKPPEEKQEPKVRERLPSVDSTRHEKIGRLFREKSQEKLMKVVPPSPTKKEVGRLLRESSIDRFENPPLTEIKKVTAISGIPSPSLAHSPKVAATRAMFEQKIDETKTDLRKKSSIVIEQRRRSSVSTASMTTGKKDASQPQHSKSYSCDFSSKLRTIQKVSEPSTGSVNRSKAVAPTPAMEKVNEPRAQSNEAKNKINSSQHQQLDKLPAHTVPVAAARKQIKTSESVSKVSRITITSVVSPNNSPILNTRKDITASSSKAGDQLSSSSTSAMLLRHPTSPSLGTNRQSSSPSGQTRVSTVSTTIRHSSPTKAATVSEITPPTRSAHSPIAKSQTEGRIQPPVNRNSGLWSSSTSFGTHTANATASTAPGSTIPTPSNRVVVKTSPKLGDNLLSSVNKSGSLQDIPAQFGDSTASPQNGSSPSSSVSASSTSGIRRGPTYKAMQRRERKDRPKTMYATRAETSNLVGLISRFQEVEKEKKLTNGVPSQDPTSSISSLKMNGSTIPAKSSGVSFSPSTIPTAVPMRQSSTAKERLARPTSYCATNSSMSNSENNSGLHFHSPSSYSSSKPAPHERMMQRSKTVAGGLGSAKLSKKGMLLKWCQIITQDYENVNISNFAESFSNGLAFCAMLHHFIPDQIPFNTLNPTNRESNFTIAFQAAEDVGIPSLLDVEDMVSLPKPDWMSVMTYVSFIYNKFGQQQQQQQQQKQSSMV